jgi:hypothetical protein
MKTIRVSILAILVAGLCSPALPADTTTTVQSFAQASLLGIQLAVKHGQQQGKVAAATADCVAAFKPDTFVEVFDKLVKSTLTEDEQQTTEAFFNSATGVKFAKLGILQVYGAVGDKAPEPLPVLTDAEKADIEAFSRTPAGDKLMLKKAFEQPAAMANINQRIKELLAQCPRN